MVDNTCGQGGGTVNSINISSKISSGWYAYPFSPVSFEMYFHVQIRLVNPKDLCVFLV